MSRDLFWGLKPSPPLETMGRSPPGGKLSLGSSWLLRDSCWSDRERVWNRSSILSEYHKVILGRNLQASHLKFYCHLFNNIKSSSLLFHQGNGQSDTLLKQTFLSWLTASNSQRFSVESGACHQSWSSGAFFLSPEARWAAKGRVFD
jgi:hypothetical protein